MDPPKPSEEPADVTVPEECMINRLICFIKNIVATIFAFLDRVLPGYEQRQLNRLQDAAKRQAARQEAKLETIGTLFEEEERIGLNITTDECLLYNPDFWNLLNEVISINNVKFIKMRDIEYSIPKLKVIESKRDECHITPPDLGTREMLQFSDGQMLEISTAELKALAPQVSDPSRLDLPSREAFDVFLEYFFESVTPILERQDDRYLGPNKKWSLCLATFFKSMGNDLCAEWANQMSYSAEELEIPDIAKKLTMDDFQTSLTGWIYPKTHPRLEKVIMGSQAYNPKALWPIITIFWNERSAIWDDGRGDLLSPDDFYNPNEIITGSDGDTKAPPAIKKIFFGNHHPKPESMPRKEILDLAVNVFTSDVKTIGSGCFWDLLDFMTSINLTTTGLNLESWLANMSSIIVPEPWQQIFFTDIVPFLPRKPQEIHIGNSVYQSEELIRMRESPYYANVTAADLTTRIYLRFPDTTELINTSRAELKVCFGLYASLDNATKTAHTPHEAQEGTESNPIVLMQADGCPLPENLYHTAITIFKTHELPKNLDESTNKKLIEFLHFAQFAWLDGNDRILSLPEHIPRATG